MQLQYFRGMGYSEMSVVEAAVISFFALYIARLLLFSKYFFLEGRGRGVGKFHFLLFISKAISLLVFCCCFLFFFSMNEGIL